MTPAYVGLGTAAGVGQGLDDLFQRELLRERAAQASRGLDLQSRGLDLEERGLGNSLETARATNARGVRAMDIDEAQFAALMPGREAQARLDSARAAAAETTNSATGKLMGLFAPDNPAGQAGSVSDTSGNRLLMDVAGVSPTAVLGPVEQTDTEWETLLDAWARDKGVQGGRGGMTFDQIQQALQTPGEAQRLEMAGQRLGISQANLDLARQRMEMQKDNVVYRRQQAESRVKTLPPEIRSLALATYNDRIRREIGPDDPSSKYDDIATQVLDFYTRKADPTAPAVGPVRRRYNPATGALE